VIEEILPYGPEKFPDDFLTEKVKMGEFIEIPLPESLLVIQRSFFGKEELFTENAEKIVVANPAEAQFVKFAQLNGHKIARLPSKPVEVSRAVKNYQQYLRDLQERLRNSFYVRTLDQSTTDRHLRQAWKQFNLPEIEG